MRLILISGNGQGAGKSYLARKLTKEVWSLANAMRSTLQQRYPGYDWFNKDQTYKDKTIVEEVGKSIRTVMIEYGQACCVLNQAYWAERLVDKLKASEYTMTLQGITIVAVDDVRKVIELEYLRSKFPDSVHLHVVSAQAEPEPQYESAQLELLADYVLRR